MSFKNKYNKYQSYQLRYQGAVNLYHRLTPNKNKKYPLTGINIGTGAKLEIIPCSELKTKKPRSILKMRARFQRANQIRYHKEMLATIEFLWDVDVEGIEKALKLLTPLDHNKLPLKIKAQVTYLKQELQALNTMLEKAVPEFRTHQTIDLINAQREALKKLLNPKP